MIRPNDRGRKVLLAVILSATVTFMSACVVRPVEKLSVTRESETISDVPEETQTENMPSSVRAEPGSSGNLADADRILSYMNSVEYHGVVLVARGGEVIFEGAYGYSDRREKTANRADTVFELGSITKQFTAVAIMMLVEQGKLSLDDPLSLYIPEYPYAEGITVRNLLNMTSGIPDYVTCGALGLGLEDLDTASVETIEQVKSIIQKDYSHAGMVESMKDYALLFEPGEEYSYSNTNYYFLGIVIEKLSGMSYFDFVEANFFEPLQMNSASTDPSVLTSKGAVLLQNGAIYLPSQNRTLSYAAGSIVSDARDLLKWEQAVMDGAFLSDDGWTQVFDPGDFDYGFGWSVGSGTYYHGGQTVGYNTHVMIEPESETVIIALSNTQGSDHYFSGEKVRSDRVVFEIYSLLELSED
ncbi:MAG: serine hydrolase [Oscillospiraceae bacterium]|nr:serine hydrolase [Oscillospiraceae bacterium]